MKIILFLFSTIFHYISFCSERLIEFSYTSGNFAADRSARGRTNRRNSVWSETRPWDRFYDRHWSSSPAPSPSPPLLPVSLRVVIKSIPALYTLSLSLRAGCVFLFYLGSTLYLAALPPTSHKVRPPGRSSARFHNPFFRCSPNLRRARPYRDTCNICTRCRGECIFRVAIKS